MGKLMSAATSGSNPRNSRKYPIDTKALLCCIAVLGETPESFRSGLEAFRKEKMKIVGNAGPSEKTWQIILNTGWASADFYASILKYGRMRLSEEHEAGRLKPQETPLPVMLAKWPAAWERLKKWIKGIIGRRRNGRRGREDGRTDRR